MYPLCNEAVMSVRGAWLSSLHNAVIWSGRGVLTALQVRSARKSTSTIEVATKYEMYYGHIGKNSAFSLMDQSRKSLLSMQAENSPLIVVSHPKIRTRAGTVDHE